MGSNVEILLVLLRLLTMQCKRTFTKRLLGFTATVTKMHVVAAIAKYIVISYKIDLQIFHTGYFFTKKQIAIVFNKTTIMSLFCLARLARIT